MAATAEEAVAAAQALGGPVWVVKAQVHAGGRGKAGGVKVARDTGGGARGGRRHARHAPGHPADRPRRPARRQGLRGSGSEIAREMYLSLTLNREQGRIALIASAAGGMDIEEVAAQDAGEDPLRERPSGRGPAALPGRELAFGLGLSGAQIAEFQAIAAALYRLYMERTRAWSRSIR